MTDQPTTVTGSSAGWVPAYGPLLWAVAVVFFGIGDAFTTSLGLVSGVVAEGGPLMAPLIEHAGVYGLVPVKLAALGLAYAAWRAVPGPDAHAIPLGFAVVGIAVTAWNLQLLAMLGLF